MNLDRTLRLILGLLIAVFLGLIGWTLRDTSAKEGGPAPTFALTTDDGHHITPTSFGGKVLVLNFWASWCAPCLQEIPSLNRFQREFAKDGVVVLAVSIDKNEQKYKHFLQRLPVSFATARDASADVSAEYGTFQVPETYIIKNGQVQRKFIGEANWVSDDVTEYVKGLLKS